MGRRRPARTPWTKSELALLGTLSDEDVAKRIGRGRNAIRLARLRRGIPSLRQRGWPKEHLDLLGTASDSDLAKRLGRTTASVYQMRRAREIPAYRPTGSTPRLREETEAKVEEVRAWLRKRSRTGPEAYEKLGRNARYWLQKAGAQWSRTAFVWRLPKEAK